MQTTIASWVFVFVYPCRIMLQENESKRVEVLHWPKFNESGRIYKEAAFDLKILYPHLWLTIEDIFSREPSPHPHEFPLTQSLSSQLLTFKTTPSDIIKYPCQYIVFSNGIYRYDQESQTWWSTPQA